MKISKFIKLKLLLFIVGNICLCMESSNQQQLLSIISKNETILNDAFQNKKYDHKKLFQWSNSELLAINTGEFYNSFALLIEDDIFMYKLLNEHLQVAFQKFPFNEKQQIDYLINEIYDKDKTFQEELKKMIDFLDMIIRDYNNTNQEIFIQLSTQSNLIENPALIFDFSIKVLISDIIDDQTLKFHLTDLNQPKKYKLLNDIFNTPVEDSSEDEFVDYKKTIQTKQHKLIKRILLTLKKIFTNSWYFFISYLYYKWDKIRDLPDDHPDIIKIFSLTKETKDYFITVIQYHYHYRSVDIQNKYQSYININVLPKMIENFLTTKKILTLDNRFRNKALDILLKLEKNKDQDKKECYFLDDTNGILCFINKYGLNNGLLINLKYDEIKKIFILEIEMFRDNLTDFRLNEFNQRYCGLNANDITYINQICHWINFNQLLCFIDTLLEKLKKKIHITQKNENGEEITIETTKYSLNNPKNQKELEEYQQILKSLVSQTTDLPNKQKLKQIKKTIIDFLCILEYQDNEYSFKYCGFNTGWYPLKLSSISGENYITNNLISIYLNEQTTLESKSNDIFISQFRTPKHIFKSIKLENISIAQDKIENFIKQKHKELGLIEIEQSVDDEIIKQVEKINLAITESTILKNLKYMFHSEELLALEKQIRYFIQNDRENSKEFNKLIDLSIKIKNNTEDTINLKKNILFSNFFKKAFANNDSAFIVRVLLDINEVSFGYFTDWMSYENHYFFYNQLMIIEEGEEQLSLLFNYIEMYMKIIIKYHLKISTINNIFQLIDETNNLNKLLLQIKDKTFIEEIQKNFYNTIQNNEENKNKYTIFNKYQNLIDRENFINDKMEDQILLINSDFLNIIKEFQTIANLKI